MELRYAENGSLDIPNSTFTPRELKDWVGKRLAGRDPYLSFSPARGEEPDTVFIAAYLHDMDLAFRPKLEEAVSALFRETLDNLDQVIGEDSFPMFFANLLNLTDEIGYYNETVNDLHQLAQSGRLKGVEYDGVDLHTRTLSVLEGSRKIFPNEFWLGQIQTGDPHYAVPAALALAHYERGLKNLRPVQRALVQLRGQYPDDMGLSFLDFTLKELFGADEVGGFLAGGPQDESGSFERNVQACGMRTHPLSKAA